MKQSTIEVKITQGEKEIKKMALIESESLSNLHLLNENFSKLISNLNSG